MPSKDITTDEALELIALGYSAKHRVKVKQAYLFSSVSYSTWDPESSEGPDIRTEFSVEFEESNQNPNTTMNEKEQKLADALLDQAIKDPSLGGNPGYFTDAYANLVRAAHCRLQNEAQEKFNAGMVEPQTANPSNPTP